MSTSSCPSSRCRKSPSANRCKSLSRLIRRRTFPGTISAINPKVENSTRNVQVRATLANPDGKLLPGMFASLQVLLPNPQPRIVVPESAITYTLYGNSVYVVAQKKAEDGSVEKNDKGEPILIAERRFIETGERREGW